MYKEKNYESGIEKLKSKDYEGAIADFSNSIEIDPNVHLPYKFRAKAKYELKDFEGAIADYDKAIKIDPSFASDYYERGFAKCGLDETSTTSSAIYDFKKAKEMFYEPADITLKDFEEQLRELAKSDDEDAEEAATLLKEHFDKDSSLKDKSEDEKELTELTPLKSDSFYYSLRRMIQYIPLDSSKWAAFLTLKRLTWFIEDEDEDTIERVRNEVSSFESLEENMISDYLIADDTTDWLQEEWNIGDNKNVCAFVDRDDFMRSLTRNDHEQSKYIVQFFEKCWNIACIEEKYQKWILNQEYENINFWFFKGDIYVVDPDYGVTITFKKKDAERIFTPTQLGHFVDRDAVNIDEDCCLMILSQITKYGDEDDYPTYSVQDLVDFWELPSDCLKYAINY